MSSEGRSDGKKVQVRREIAFLIRAAFLIFNISVCSA